MLIRLHDASFAEDRPVARRRAAARPRVIGGSASPRSPEFFQKTSPVFKSFSKVYYAGIVKSPLISALQPVARFLRLGAFGPALDLAPRPLIWVGARGAAATAVASGVFVTAAWSGRKVHTSVYVVPTQVVGAAGYLRRWGLVG